MRYSGHLIDLCKDILALWVYDELTKSQVVRCRKTRLLGVHVLIECMVCKDYAEIRLRDLKCRRSWQVQKCTCRDQCLHYSKKQACRVVQKYALVRIQLSIRELYNKDYKRTYRVIIVAF